MGFIPATAVTATVALTAYGIITVGTHKLAKSFWIQPKFDNSGVTFIGDSTLDLTTTPYTGVIKQLPKPSVDSIPEFHYTEVDVPNGIDLGELRVASTQAGDIYIISYNEQ